MTVSLAAPGLLITRMIRCFPDETAALGDCSVRMQRYFRFTSLSLRAGEALSFTHRHACPIRADREDSAFGRHRVSLMARFRFGNGISSPAGGEGRGRGIVTARFVRAASSEAIDAPQMIKRMRAMMKSREGTAR